MAIANISPVAYWDLGDYCRDGGDPQSLADVSHTLFTRNAGTSSKIRTPLPISPDATNSSTGWTSGSDPCSFNFNRADNQSFYLLNTDAGFSDYAEILNLTGAFLIWARIRVDSIAGTGVGNSVLSIRGKDGATDTQLDFKYRDQGASDQRMITELNFGTGIESIPGGVNAITSTALFYNVSVFCDFRSVDRHGYAYQQGSLQNSPYTSQGPLTFPTDNANHALCIGGNKAGASVSNLMDGEIMRVGLMNFGSNPPDNMSNICKQLNLSDGVPGNFMDGI